VLAWPLTREELIEEQLRLAALAPVTWQFEPDTQIGGVFVCFARGESGRGLPANGRGQQRAWAEAPQWLQVTLARRTSRARARTPEPLRWARRRAREARALDNSDDWRKGRERWQT
jgi:hypothetical protein